MDKRLRWIAAKEAREAKRARTRRRNRLRRYGFRLTSVLVVIGLLSAWFVC